MTYLCLGIYTVICLQTATEVILKAGKYKNVNKKTRGKALIKKASTIHCPSADNSDAITFLCEDRREVIGGCLQKIVAVTTQGNELLSTSLITTSVCHLDT